jgi:ABC-type oligopeptide transport system substrate-binding subunit
MNSKLKAAIIIIAVSSLFIGVVAAASIWTGTRTHTQTSSVFTVNKPTSLDYGIADSAVEVFTVTNTGNQPLTITASASGTGGTYVWDKTSATLAAGAFTTFQLTSTFTASGTTTITFTPS